MNGWVAIRTAWAALRKNLLRSALATLGIIIAVSAVVATVALGQGARHKVAEQMAALGTNMLVVSPGSVRSHGVSSGSGGGHTLTLEDGDAIARDLAQYTDAVAPVTRTSAQVVYGNVNWSTSVIGTAEGYFSARQWKLQEGRLFTHDENLARAKVCVLGHTVAEHLFGSESGLGESIRVKTMPCRVVGVLQAKGQGGFGQDQDDAIIMPWGTLTRRLVAMQNNAGLTLIVAARDGDMTQALQQQIIALLRQRHRLAPEADADFSVFDVSEVQDATDAQMKTLSLLLGSVALISLFVGAIGIANVMLVSVTERTREIGIRMAVGAQRRDVLVQFLVEAILLSLLGGGVGLLLGAAIAKYMARAGHWPMLVSAPIMAGTLCLAGLAGIIAGFYPAWRASRLDPIEALRYE